MRKTFSTFEVHRPEGMERITMVSQGQTAHILRLLVECGERGLTALEVLSGCLRVSEYIRRLRHEFGLDIETIKESHLDQWGNEGWHGRYVLRDSVRRVPTQEDRA